MVMLDTQYRMHPEISAFPNKTFYDSQLMDGTVSPEGDVRPDLVAPDTAFLPVDNDGKSKHMSFINHSFPETLDSRSLHNVKEANVVASVVLDILIRNPVCGFCIP